MKIPSKDHPTSLRATSQDVAPVQGKFMSPPPFELGATEGKQEGKVAQASQENGGFGGNAFMNLAWNHGGGADFMQCLEFAPLFNEKFKSVLHAFAADGGTKAKLGEASGEGLSVEQLMKLFTGRQRRLIMDFIQTGMIPERLFTGDGIGTATAQQRILIASIIIAQGKYRPGSFEQEVHAKFCGHWVQVVQNYAGVTSHHGANADSINGNFDLFGDVVLGADSATQVYKGDRLSADKLPKYENDEYGPIHKGTDHYDSAVKRDPQAMGNPFMNDQFGYESYGDHSPEGRYSPENHHGREYDYGGPMNAWDDFYDDKKDSKPKVKPFRAKHFDFDLFDQIQPGDWLYIYNANGAGEHSVIFSHWASNDVVLDNGLKYREAITFDQNQPITGGTEKMRRLGNMFNDESPSVSPITYISRVNPDAGQVENLEELLPTRNEGEIKLEEDNLKYINQLEKRYKGSVSMEKLYQKLIDENQGHIEYLADRLTEGQRALLESGNVPGDLEQLIRLTQKLRQLRTNATILKGNNDKIFEGKLNEKYEAAIGEYRALEERINAEIFALEEERSELKETLEPMENELENMTHANEISKMRSEQTELKKELSSLAKGGPEYRENRRRYKELINEITRLKNEAKPFKEEAKPLRKDTSKLKKKIAGLDMKISKKYKELDAAGKVLPFGTVAAGGNSDQDKSNMKAAETGELWTVLSDKEIKAMME